MVYTITLVDGKAEVVDVKYVEPLESVVGKTTTVDEPDPDVHVGQW